MALGYQVVRDPVHGFVKLNDIEMAIVSTPPFERLRYVRQLALTYLVYPGAEHSRFAHSLGVMNLATRIYDTLMEKHRKELDWDQKRVDRNRQILRLAALLHDVGHPPFSHASEELLDGTDHEEFSTRFMKAEPIASLINRFEDLEITAEDVAGFFSADNIDANTAFLREIFSGEIDADKIDYLQRDSLYTGVHYGRFDVDRLVHSLTLIKDPREKFGNYILAIEYGGLHALEAMVLARYFMFTQVYFHKIRRAFDHHLVSFLKKHVGHYPKELDDYLKCDDNFVFGLLRKHSDDEDAQRILQRRPFKEAFTTHEHINEEQRTRFWWMWEKFKNEFGDIGFFDTAEKSPHKFERIGTYTISKTTGQPALVVNESGIIKSLKNIEEYRIFVAEDKRDQVQKFCRDFWASAGKKPQ